MFRFRSLLDFWNHFFFEEKTTEGISLFRILWMMIIFVHYLFDLSNISDFYGPHALTSIQTVKEQFPFFHANLFHLSNGGYEFTYGLALIYGIALITSIFGLYTRISIITVLLCMTSFHQRNIWLLSSSEVLMRTITLLLIFTPCGHSFSIDSLISFRKRKWPIWGTRLIQIQLSVVYLWTAWHKLKGDTWIDGSAVYYATRLEGFTNNTLPFVLDSILFLKLATWGTLIVEMALASLIWFSEFRKPLIYIGIIFHLVIEYLMSIPFFELYMIALLCLFFTPEEIRMMVSKASSKLKAIFQKPFQVKVS